MVAGMRTPVGGWFLVAAVLLVIGLWRDPVQAQAPEAAAACTPRPAVGVSVTPNADGRLQVTVAANTNSSTPTNQLSQIRFGAATGASIEITGKPPGQADNFTVNFTPPVSSTQFFVRQGTSGQAATVRLTVVDGCGDWPTFVGGGPAAFATTAPPPTPTRTPTATPTSTVAGKAGPIVTADLGAGQQIVGGQAVTVYWSGLTNAGSKDQIGMYRTADTAHQSNRLQTPLFTGGLASGNANVTVTNDVLLDNTDSDTFLLILYHVDAASPTPSFVTQSQPFTVVRNTVAPGQVKAPGGAPASIRKPAASKGGQASGGMVASSGARIPLVTPATVRGPLVGSNSFAGATLLSTLPARDTTDTSGATTETGEPQSCSGAGYGQTVWYRMTPSSGLVTVDTFGSNFDTVLAIYTGAAVSALTLIGCNDDAAPV
jgi:hypothetical protein